MFFANRISTKSKPKNTLIRLNSNQFARYGLDWKGRMQQGLIGANFNLSLQKNIFIYTEFGLQWEKIYEDEFGPRRNFTTGQQGAFVGAPSTPSQPSLTLASISTRRSTIRISIYGFVGSIFNALDYDFGARAPYPRASPAFRDYIQGTDYNEYIRQLYLYQANPTTVPFPNFPSPPALDPGQGWQFDLNFGGEYKPIEYPFRISLDYTKSRLTRNDTGKVAFDTNIFTLR